jgi:predicted nucleic acid-binding protein
MFIVLDVTFIIAFLLHRDPNHYRISAFVKELKTNNPTVLFIITNFVLAETLTRIEHTHKVPKTIVIDILNRIESDESIKIATIDEVLFSKTLRYYKQYLDKNWSVVEFTTYAYMKENNLECIGSIGHDHVKQFGFNVIP